MERIDKLKGTFDKKYQDIKGTVSSAVIKRLPRYHRYLGDLLRDGKLRISSAELSELMGLTASQIRQDLNCFGGFGQQGYGYNIRYLYTKISDLLGVSAGYKAVIIGAGNLGKALAATHMFERRGVARLGMFDVNPDLVGKCVYGTPVYHIDELYDFCIANGVSIGVLTVPKESAAEITDILYKAGVKGVWNFANMELKSPSPNMIVENIHLGDSLMTLTYRIKSMSEEDTGNE